MKTLELPITRDYVRHWGLDEAVRELLQNALDSESPFEYEINEDLGVLKIHSRYTTLTRKTLLLGNTSKTDNPSSIGQFGEGYKLALLVLARMGVDVLVHNGQQLWFPEFRHSKAFDTEVLCIRTQSAVARREGLTFELSGLSPEDLTRIRNQCLRMWSDNDLGEVIEVEQGRILLEHPGVLYVNGLFITESKLKYGYDIKPEYIQLERDRQTVAEFELRWTTRDMWYSSERYDQIAEMIDTGVPDLELAQWSSPTLVKEACFRRFQEKHPGAIVARDQDEFEVLINQGLTNVVHVSTPGMYHNVTASSGYKGSRDLKVQVPKPYDVVKRFFEEHKEGMDRETRRDYKNLLSCSKQWRNK